MSKLESSGPQVRLQKYIADCGITSRRKAEDLIILKKVKVNDQYCTTLGTKIDPNVDVVEVNGRIVDVNSVQKIYLILNKPRGYVTTLNDPEGRNTVLDLIKLIPERLYPVGRLDYLSEGLIIMTNDGKLANMVMHPKYEIVKTYEVKVFGIVTEKILQEMKQGVYSDGEFLKPESVRIVKILPNKTWLEFRLKEGKNREIRRMCESLNLTIDKLRRVAIGGLSIGEIPIGKFSFINKKQLMNLIGMNPDGSKRKIAAPVFVSPKKSLNPFKETNKPLAKSDEFHKYRKDKYYETIQSQQLVKELEELADNDSIYG